ncbi:RRQRL motif-containing zinc-binding protein [Cryptosporangium sp. NPDC051539]|uniref:RRQRL motif-containing zinc-binding protein n=1 Tax=Cryptosporangium sp. NPDC051539 TaxID=3363962 RepID=UPI0037B9451B
MSRIRAEYMDPAGARHGGLPTAHWGGADPSVYATRRQLAADGLQPNRQPIAAQILWWGIDENGRGTRVAYLYLRSLAAPKRPATAAQLAALEKANRARRTCSTCGDEKPYIIPRSLGECIDCHDAPWMEAA